MVVLKTNFNGDVRRFDFPGEGSFNRFVGILKMIYSKNLPDVVALTYKDEEGDNVTIARDEDMKEACCVAIRNRTPLLIRVETPKIAIKRSREEGGDKDCHHALRYEATSLSPKRYKALLEKSAPGLIMQDPYTRSRFLIAKKRKSGHFVRVCKEGDLLSVKPHSFLPPPTQ